MTGTDVYTTTLRPSECFVDQTYQRLLDVARARTITASWDRRLVGIIEVSDRGPDASPRYAVVDGQHRWAAARFLQNPPQLVANVHEGLTVEQEAELFDKLNRQRRQPTTWDHWKARRAAGDTTVAAIERVVAKAGLVVTETTGRDGAVWCISTMEKIFASGGPELLQMTLDVITIAWGHQRAAVEAPMVHGIAMALQTFDGRISAQRLDDALTAVAPKRIRVMATTLRDDAGMTGSLAKLTAVAIINLYNGLPGAKLQWPNTWRGTLAKPAPEPRQQPVPPSSSAGAKTALPEPDTASAAPEPVPASTVSASGGDCEATVAADHPAATAERSEAITTMLAGTATPDDLYDQVDAMAGRDAAEVADALGITERRVRQIRAEIDGAVPQHRPASRLGRV
ncbi:DUF6551 family protein [Mycolicibacterium mucogenicum]|uniref:ParB/Sulfiredoxin domain-containing protein n=1 Tax=Mycolicibacterium mucogenicum DSM 44124 TaxID=1226753 RepID=A0A8H2PIA6_MYCMU|nr:DUF6551 family protein [Mycolicibacterium mucogenicum]KAB7752781.1 hypothetical protein MMUC44124_26625 [Mycolicibacterium mucogenicum DSM 44124]QPG69115.1 hypothetical protein C1S78_027640 [Mycolicibacterium mucogenicum DSM 44124]